MTLINKILHAHALILTLLAHIFEKSTFSRWLPIISILRQNFPFFLDSVNFQLLSEFTLSWITIERHFIHSYTSWEIWKHWLYKDITCILSKMAAIQKQGNIWQNTKWYIILRKNIIQASYCSYFSIVMYKNIPCGWILEIQDGGQFRVAKQNPPKSVSHYSIGGYLGD